MSYNFEGKVVNQKYSLKIDGNILCGCCRKQIENPTNGILVIWGNDYIAESYIHTPYYIYETKSGIAVVYCSDKCRRKHNHRFTRKGKNEDYEHSLVQRIVKLENHIKKNLRVGDLVIDDLTRRVGQVLENVNGKIILDICVVPRNLWEISLIIK